MSTKSRGVLGKGLNALIPKAVPAQVVLHKEHEHPVASTKEPDHGMISEIEIDRIEPNPYQPRQDFDAQALDELRQSIARKGLVQPVTVRRSRDGMYQLISGERRVRAARDAGLTRIPAYIVEVHSDEEMLELALIENLQREHLNPIEVAISYQRLLDECHLTQEQVGQRIGKDRTTVTNFLRLLRLPAPIQQSLRKGELTVGHARAMVNLADEKTQLRVWKRTVKHGLSVREVEELVRRIGTTGAAKTKTVPPQEVDTESPPGNNLVLENIAARMRYILGTKVKIYPKEDARGEIVIEYYSADDLERIVDLFGIIEKNA